MNIGLALKRMEREDDFLGGRIRSQLDPERRRAVNTFPAHYNYKKLLRNIKEKNGPVKIYPIRKKDVC